MPNKPELDAPRGALTAEEIGNLLTAIAIYSNIDLTHVSEEAAAEAVAHLLRAAHTLAQDVKRHDH